MKVSLVSTVKDVGPAHMREFLDSLRAQSRPPEETIIVDGGSTDGTLEVLREAPDITVISEPGAGISRGRNVAIAAAAHGVIAVTDADCVLAADWLERLLAPIENGADVSAGFYRALGDSLFQISTAAVSIREPEEVGPGWLPSSRSIAFRRGAYDAAGGYPEWLGVGEDMYFDHQLVAAGTTIEPAVDAVVRWRVRPTPASTWRQYAGYAEGDAAAGLYPERHFLRFAAYALLTVAVVKKNRPLLALATAGAVQYAVRPVWRAWRRLEGRDTERLASLVTVPAAMALIDAAKMWGYARGLARRVAEEVLYD
ncbi:MAG TPA: glycosyltransferase [Actinomycetota bacterium]|nr:glycosyltransferase [Actinomycetota bacterium]